jgi:NAD(P)-dependent dehydrogenase (short-subunit alcohol dehydrogenase family)
MKKPLDLFSTRLYLNLPSAQYLITSLITGVTANSVHPGTVLSDVWRALPKILKVPFYLMAKIFFKVRDKERINLTAFI